MKSKIYRGKCYKVIAPNMSHGLSIGYAETAEAAVAKTLESEKRAKEKGYSGDRWFIIETKWARVFDKNDEFLRENEHSEVVAIVNADGTVEYK